MTANPYTTNDNRMATESALARLSLDMLVNIVVKAGCHVSRKDTSLVSCDCFMRYVFVATNMTTESTTTEIIYGITDPNIHFVANGRNDIT